jgi:hypothetical protein
MQWHGPLCRWLEVEEVCWRMCMGKFQQFKGQLTVSNGTCCSYFELTMGAEEATLPVEYRDPSLLWNHFLCMYQILESFR